MIDYRPMPTSRGLAHVLIAVGFLAASVAYGAYAIINTLLDPDATAEMTADLLSAAPIRDDLTHDLAAELRSQLPTGVESREATSIATAALADPRFAEAFAAAVRSLHEQLLGAGPLVVFIAVPWLIGSLTGAWGDVASPITASLGRRLIPSALLLALSGLLLSAGARFFASRRRAGTEGGPGIAALQSRAG